MKTKTKTIKKINKVIYILNYTDQYNNDTLYILTKNQLN